MQSVYIKLMGGFPDSMKKVTEMYNYWFSDI